MSDRKCEDDTSRQKRRFTIDKFCGIIRKVSMMRRELVRHIQARMREIGRPDLVSLKVEELN
jgi:hypothetical protein